LYGKFTEPARLKFTLPGCGKFTTYYNLKEYHILRRIHTWGK